LSLSLPKYDENGRIVPHDHDGIENDDWVIRRISVKQLVDDPKVTGGRRISSLAFNASTGPNGGMSVDLHKQIEGAGLNAVEYVTTPIWIGSVRFVVNDLRSESFKVGYDPIPDNPYHGEVWGAFTNSKQRKLKSFCQWFVAINGVSIL